MKKKKKKTRELTNKFGAWLLGFFSQVVQLSIKGFLGDGLFVTVYQNLVDDLGTCQNGTAVSIRSMVILVICLKDCGIKAAMIYKGIGNVLYCGDPEQDTDVLNLPLFCHRE